MAPGRDRLHPRRRRFGHDRIACQSPSAASVRLCTPPRPLRGDAQCPVRFGSPWSSSVRTDSDWAVNYSLSSLFCGLSRKGYCAVGTNLYTVQYLLCTWRQVLVVTPWGATKEARRKMDSACDDQFALGVAERFESFLENFTSRGSTDGATTEDETLHDYLEQAVWVCGCVGVCWRGGGVCASRSLRNKATARKCIRGRCAVNNE